MSDPTTRIIVNPRIPHVGGYRWAGEKPYNLITKTFELLKPESVLDVGCGPCASMLKFVELGVKRVHGIDGDPQLKQHPLVQPFLDRITIHDLEAGPWYDVPDSGYDLVWSFEVAEHIGNSANFVNTLAGNAAKWIVMSHSMDSRSGHHHVNCQQPKYWIDKFQAEGFLYDEATTNILKEANRLDGAAGYFVSNHPGQSNGLVFQRKTCS